MSKMENIFFSTTFGGELSSIAAAVATIEKLEQTNAVGRIKNVGNTIMTELNKKIEKVGLNSFVRYTGEAWWRASF